MSAPTVTRYWTSWMQEFDYSGKQAPNIAKDTVVVTAQEHDALVTYWREQAVWAAKELIDEMMQQCVEVGLSREQAARTLETNPRYQRALAIGKEGEG